MKRFINVITALFIFLAVLVWALPHLGICSYEILSDSMVPTFKTGDIVLANSKKTEISVGDIIVFHMGDAAVVHRVEDITEEGIITKGDANSSEDFGVREKGDVIGKVICGLGIFSGLFEFMAGNGKIAVIAILIILNVIVDRDKKSVRRRGVKEQCVES